MALYDSFFLAYCEKAVGVLFSEVITDLLAKLISEPEFQSLEDVQGFYARVAEHECSGILRESMRHSIVPKTIEVGVEGDEHGRLRSYLEPSIVLTLRQYAEVCHVVVHLRATLTGHANPTIVWDGARVLFLLPNLLSITYTARRVGMIVAEREEEPW
ncbi:hypothetical protein HYV71_04090 [Candidatus Uhrbacteria bacterium]|nr:hypothetical protein [Candidatus Uhrbacteria bacterium]